MTCNAEIGPTEVRDFCQTDASGEKLLKAAVQQLHLSARVYYSLLKLARMIADLEENDCRESCGVGGTVPAWCGDGELVVGDQNDLLLVVLRFIRKN